MTKYNIKEKSEHIAAYRTCISPAVMDDLQARILDILLIKKMYKNKDYSAKQLAQDLGTNSRYVSAVVNVKFHMNYTSLVNKYRIEEAMSLLVDKRYRNLNMEDISEMVGFANRQSFYSAFYRLQGCTPRDYKMRYIRNHPDKVPARGRKTTKTASDK